MLTVPEKIIPWVIYHKTEKVSFEIRFHPEVDTTQRRNKIYEVLNFCAEHLTLPSQVVLHINKCSCFHDQDGKYLGYALKEKDDNNNTHIVIAKSKLVLMQQVIAHELGHLEHFLIYPELQDRKKMEDYAITVECFYAVCEQNIFIPEHIVNSYSNDYIQFSGDALIRVNKEVISCQ